MGKLAILEGGQDGGVSVVVNNAGKIECIDLDDRIDQNYQNCTFVEEIDASGMCVLPGKGKISVQLHTALRTVRPNTELFLQRLL